MYYGQSKTILEQGSTGVPPSVPFSQPKNLFRFGEQTLWSTQLLAQGTDPANATFRLFTTPLGQQGQGFLNALSIGETNLKEGGRIPNGIAYDVFGVACQLGKTSSAEAAGSVGIMGQLINTEARIDELVSVQTNCVLSWDFTQTQVDIAPVELIGAGGGLYGSISTDDSGAGAVATVGTMNNGAGSVWLYRKHPVALPGSSTFSILARFGSRIAAIGGADDDFFIKVVLLGYYKNVIEIG